MSKLIRRIAVATDGSEGALHAVRFATDLSLTLGADLWVLNVVQLTSAEAMGMHRLPKEEVRRHIDALAEGTFMKTAAEIGADVNYERVVLLGDPSQEITGWAKTHDIDHVVIGSRGLSPWKELMLGSVSEKVVRHAHCPVTVVR